METHNKIIHSLTRFVTAPYLDYFDNTLITNLCIQKLYTYCLQIFTDVYRLYTYCCNTDDIEVLKILVVFVFTVVNISKTAVLRVNVFFVLKMGKSFASTTTKLEYRQYHLNIHGCFSSFRHRGYISRIGSSRNNCVKIVLAN